MDSAFDMISMHPAPLNPARAARCWDIENLLQPIYQIGIYQYRHNTGLSTLRPPRPWSYCPTTDHAIMCPKRTAHDDTKPAKRVRKASPYSPLPIGKKGKDKQKAIKSESKSEPESEERSHDEGEGSQSLEALASSPGPRDSDEGLGASLPIIDAFGEVVQEYEVSAKYNQSMYVDAFNLALDTVLKDESHLFSEAETEVFAKYRSLDYEAQNLYSSLYYWLLILFYFPDFWSAAMFVCFYGKTPHGSANVGLIIATT